MPALWVLLALVASPVELSREERVRQLKARSWDVQAGRLASELRIDGRLSDPAWLDAPPVSDFYQRERNEGLPATEPTEVRVLYDDTTLYIAFRCYDSEPARVSAKAIFRDEGGADDLIAVMLDAYHDHRGAIQFVTNANGLVFELLQTGETERTRNSDWNMVWQAKGAYTDEGWEAEFAIPFKSRRFEPRAPGEEVVFNIGFKRKSPARTRRPTGPS